MRAADVFISAPGKPVPPAKKAVNYLLVCVAVVAVVAASLSAAGIALNFDFVGQYRVRIADGFLMTVWLSVASLACSMAIGIPVAIGQGCRFVPVQCLCDLYVKIIRGTPPTAADLLLLLHNRHRLGRRQQGGGGHRHTLAILGGLHRRIVRAGYESLPKGPLEAARALGLSRLQTMTSVALPQMVTRTLPALTGQFASIIKDSSLLSVIAVIELTQTMREISATNYNFFGCFLLLGALYLCLTLPIMFVSRHFEKKMSYSA